jgi:hypothetical protein
MDTVACVLELRGGAIVGQALAALAPLCDLVVAVAPGAVSPVPSVTGAPPVRAVLRGGRVADGLRTSRDLGADWVVVLRDNERMDAADACALRAFLERDALARWSFGLRRFRTWDDETYEPNGEWAYRVFAPHLPIAARAPTTVRLRAVGEAPGAPPDGALCWRPEAPAAPVVLPFTTDPAADAVAGAVPRARWDDGEPRSCTMPQRRTVIATRWPGCVAFWLTTSDPGAGPTWATTSPSMRPARSSRVPPG